MSNKIDISQIKKYLHGQLDAQSMHQLERQAQDDPFLMDALEGYERTGVNDQHLTDLQVRLQQRLERKEAKIISMRMIAIAASVVAIFTIGGLWYYNSAPQTEQLAAQADKTKVVPKPPEQPAAGNVIPDPILVDSTSNIAVLRSPAPPALRSRKLVAPNPELKPADEPSAAPQMFDKVAAAPEQKKQVDFREMAVMGYSRQKARKADSSENQTSTKTAPGVLNEVTLSGYMQTTGATRPEKAQPKNGWDSYDQYIKDNSTSPDGLTGTVKVQFIVDGDGSISTIRIKRSLSPAADQKAITAVKNGPKWWGNANRKPKTFTIKFKFSDKQ